MRAAHRRIQHAPGNVRDHELGLVLADHPHDVSPQLEVRRKVTILVTEELDLLDPEHLRRRPLLALADRDQLGVLLLRVLATLRAVSDDHVGDLCAVLRQLGHRAAGAKLGIVRVREHAEHAIELLVVRGVAA